MLPLQIDLQQSEPVVRAALDRACREWGVFYLVGHDLSAPRQAALLGAQRRFFTLDSASKMSLRRTADNPWGFYDQELTKNARDCKEIYDFGPASGAQQPQWPEDLPGFAAQMHDHYEACEQISRCLLGLLEANLGADSGTLARDFEAHTSFLRLNYYPLCAQPAAADSPTTPEQGQLGIHHHTDAGALTVLLQDQQAGLQVEHGQQWITVLPREGALIVNIGDIVQVWSNDLYAAPSHRVLASADAERYSAAFFFNPSYATDYAPLTAVEEHRYRAINWGEFRAGRAAGDYADVGSEIQISDFRRSAS